MNAIPQDILIARALSALESAEILLIAGQNLKALDDLEKGMNLLREVLD